MCDNYPEMRKLIPNRDILTILECPVCHGVPYPPIYQCIAGHDICKLCRPMLHKCRTCEKELTDTRNDTVEKIVLASPHSCANKDEGCRIVESGEMLDNHIKTCQYRSFMCPGNGVGNNCTEPNSIKLSQARDHFSTAHKSVKTDSKRIFELPFTSVVGDHSKLTGDIAWPPRLIELDRKVFLCQFYTRNNGIFYWTSFCFGTEEEAGKYKAEMTFSSEKNSTKFQWTVAVQPIIKCEQLRDGNDMKDVVIPFCDFRVFKNVAVRDDVTAKYRFQTEFKISKL